MSDNTAMRKVRFDGDFAERDVVIFKGSRGRVVAVDAEWVGFHGEKLVPVMVDREEIIYGARPDELKHPVVRKRA